MTLIEKIAAGIIIIAIILAIYYSIRDAQSDDSINTLRADTNTFLHTLTEKEVSYIATETDIGIDITILSDNIDNKTVCELGRKNNSKVNIRNANTGITKACD